MAYVVTIHMLDIPPPIVLAFIVSIYKTMQQTLKGIGGGGI